MTLYDTSYRHREARPARVGQVWTDTERQALRDGFNAGVTLECLCLAHLRNPGGILNELRKARLIKYTDGTYSAHEYCKSPTPAIQPPTLKETTKEPTMEIHPVIRDRYIGPLAAKSSLFEELVDNDEFNDLLTALREPVTDLINSYNKSPNFKHIDYTRTRVAVTMWEMFGGDSDNGEYRKAEKLVSSLNPVTFRPSTDAISPAPATPETTIMNSTSTQAFATVSYVYGRPVKDLSEAELISAIKGLEKEIADLGTVKTASTKITAKIEELNGMLAQVVAALDAK